MSLQILVGHLPRSSSGRTPGSRPGNAGSIPARGAKGPFVQRSGCGPFKAETRVRVPHGLPEKGFRSGDQPGLQIPAAGIDTPGARQRTRGEAANAAVCKTAIRRCKSCRVLQPELEREPGAVPGPVPKTGEAPALGATPTRSANARVVQQENAGLIRRRRGCDSRPWYQRLGTQTGKAA